MSSSSAAAAAAAVSSSNGSSSGSGTYYAGPGSSSSSSSMGDLKTPPLWEMTMEQLQVWFQTSPLLQASQVVAAAAAAAASNKDNSKDNSNSKQMAKPDPHVAWQNITTALTSLTETTALSAAQQVAARVVQQQQQQQQQQQAAQAAAAVAAQEPPISSSPPRKRIKTARSSSERNGGGGNDDAAADFTTSGSHGGEMLLDVETAALLAAASNNKNSSSHKQQQQQPHVLHDPYRIWLHVPSRPYSSRDVSFRVLGNQEMDQQKTAVEIKKNDIDDDDDDNDNDTDQKDKKKKRKKNKVVVEQEEDEEDYDTDIPVSAGGKLAQLSIDGLLNAMAGIPGGLVGVPGATTDSAANNAQQPLQQQPQFWRSLAVTWHRSLQFTIRQDILRTTPLRIQAMLAADLTPAEFASIRKRIYDTVILGKKSTYNNTNANFPNDVDDDSEDEDDDVYDDSNNGAGGGGNSDNNASGVDDGSGGGKKNGKKKKGNGTSTSSSGKAASAGRNNDTLHEIEKLKKCQTCGNNDQSLFVLDLKNGDVICYLCGTVVSESIMHEGSQYRKFEGEADRNHHGDAANPLYSNAHNMSTTLSGVQMTSGAGQGGWRSGGEKGGGGKNYETILRNAHAYTELNVSQFGKTDRRTRIGYKDRQKREAFINMAHTGDALNLHEAVVQRAKELFAGFRDDRELVQQFKGVIAACLCEAFEQLSSQGQAILKQQQLAAAAGTSNNSNNNTLDLADALDAAAGAQKKSAEMEKANAGGGGNNSNKKNNGDPALGLVVTSLSARAARRNELHNATMAGRGGILLDLTTVQQQNPSSTSSSGGGAAAAAGNNGNGAVVDKPAPSWDLEDCRSWLLDASRKIAQHWIQQRQVQMLSDDKKKPSTTSSAGAGAAGGTLSTATTMALGGTIPSGTLEELEGMLVEHSFTLCEYLEAELAKSSSVSSNNTAAAGQHQRRVITPRVNNMAKLGIKWQHSHERGSGGKGGVGGSGKGKVGGGGIAANGTGKPLPNGSSSGGGGGGKKAGQILILLTAKRLGSILKDNVSGEAIHKELRSVVGKQEARKLKERSEEASRQRLQQMHRKPWIQARAQMQT